MVFACRIACVLFLTWILQTASKPLWLLRSCFLLASLLTSLAAAKPAVQLPWRMGPIPSGEGGATIHGPPNHIYIYIFYLYCLLHCLLDCLLDCLLPSAYWLSRKHKTQTFSEAQPLLGPGGAAVFLRLLEDSEDFRRLPAWFIWLGSESTKPIDSTREYIRNHG